MFIKNSPNLTKKFAYDTIFIPNLSYGRAFVMEENKINVKRLTAVASVVLVLCVIVGALVFVFGKPAAPLLEGKCYSFGAPGDIEHYTSISFSHGKFAIMFPYLSCYIGIGDYSVSGDVLTLPTDDGQYVYRFFIRENGEKLVFDGKNSSEMKWFSEMTDGSEFVILELGSSLLENLREAK